MSLTQARAIAGEWKAARRAGHDPVIEWEALLASERADETAREAAIAAEADQPTVREAVGQFMAKHMEGKKSAPAIRYRLDRMSTILGDWKIRDVTRQNVIEMLEGIAEGQRKGKSAKQLAGEVLTQSKRLWRFAEAREWVATSCIEVLTRKDIDARPVKRDVALRLDELVEVWNPKEKTEMRADVKQLRDRKLCPGACVAGTWAGSQRDANLSTTAVAKVLVYLAAY